MVAVADDDVAVKASAHEERLKTEPQWLRALALAAATLVGAFGAVGLLFADLGIYRPLFVFPLGALGWLGLLALGRPLLSTPRSSARGAQVVAALAVAFVVAVSVWHIANASQHVLIDRDPASYATTGRWIASHGDLTVNARVAPFAHEPGLTFSSFAVYDHDNDQLTFQFAHFLPAVLAEAHGIGGDRLMFAMPGILSGIALLAFFLAAWRLIQNPYVALGALVAFAFLLPEVWFSRDTFSELPTQVLLFTALWVLLDRANLLRPRIVLLVALMLGALQSVRIDALAHLLGLPLLFAVTFVSSVPSHRATVRRSAAACGLGLAPGLVLGFCDLAIRSPQYLADLSATVRQLIGASLATVVVSLLVVVAVPPMRNKLAGRGRAAVLLWQKSSPRWSRLPDSAPGSYGLVSSTCGQSPAGSSRCCSRRPVSRSIQRVRTTSVRWCG